jgi:hypothetical protein
MSKKKLKKMLRRAMKQGYGAGKNAQPGDVSGFAANGDGYGFGYGDDDGAYAAGDARDGRGFGAGAPFGKGFLSNLGLPRGFASGQTEQFILGALLGGAAAYVLADEDLRNKLVKALMKLYAGLTGGIEEFKEQMADLKAEVEAEHGL